MMHNMIYIFEQIKPTFTLATFFTFFFKHLNHANVKQIGMLLSVAIRKDIKWTGCVFINFLSVTCSYIFFYFLFDDIICINNMQQFHFKRES